MVQTKNISVDQMFLQFDSNKGGQLDINEFYNLLVSLDPRITFKESQHVFEVLDISKDGSISKKELESVFNQWDFSDTKDSAQHIITDLKEIIKNN